MVEVMTKELSIVGLIKLKESEMFARYVVAQETKASASKHAVQLRDRHQLFKERKQRLKEMKYEDWILSMDISAMCLEDQTQYGAMQEEIRSRYCKSSSTANLD